MTNYKDMYLGININLLRRGVQLNTPTTKADSKGIFSKEIHDNAVKNL
jgi:hypothetical protein